TIQIINANELANDNEILLDGLFDNFDQFINKIRENLDTDSPIPKKLLSSEAIPLIREEGLHRGKPLEGSEYLFPLNTDFEGWIKDFETVTVSKYIKHQENQSVNGTCTYYRCHHGGTYKSVAGNNL
ncbi:13091_t:CDS:1, partial [Racocetra fulgida]